MRWLAVRAMSAAVVQGFILRFDRTNHMRVLQVGVGELAAPNPVRMAAVQPQEL